MLLFLTFIFALNMYLTVKELESEIVEVQAIQNAEIEKLEQEIRMMKTDIDICINGFEK
jgi:cell division protein FtsB